MIQIAASLVHLTRGNSDGALKLFEKAKRRLEPLSGEIEFLNKLLEDMPSCLSKKIPFPKLGSVANFRRKKQQL